MQLCARPHLSDWLRQRSPHEKVLNSLQSCLAQGKLDYTTSCLLLYMSVCTCAHECVCVCVYFQLSYPVGRTSKRKNTDQELHYSAHSFLPSELSLSIESSQHWVFVWGVDPCTNKPSVCRLLEWDWCLYSRSALPLYWLLCVSLTDCRVSLLFFWVAGFWGTACRGP